MRANGRPFALQALECGLIAARELAAAARLSLVVARRCLAARGQLRASRSSSTGPNLPPAFRRVISVSLQFGAHVSTSACAGRARLSLGAPREPGRQRRALYIARPPLFGPPSWPRPGRPARPMDACRLSLVAGRLSPGRPGWLAGHGQAARLGPPFLPTLVGDGDHLWDHLWEQRAVERRSGDCVEHSVFSCTQRSGQPGRARRRQSLAHSHSAQLLAGRSQLATRNSPRCATGNWPPSARLIA